jgi:ferredoxin-NADP reductase
MARWLGDTAQPVDVRFLHFARSPADLVFEQELRLLARGANFQFDFVCTRVDPSSAWTGPRGRIQATSTERYSTADNCRFNRAFTVANKTLYLSCCLYRF